MPLRCYYEVLSVAQDVEQDEIRKAYRRQALQWHPGEARAGFDRGWASDEPASSRYDAALQRRVDVRS
jgi:curved DNA-binding protein CbpA